MKNNWRLQRAKAQKRKLLMAHIGVIAFFVLANLIIAIVFWPMLKSHLDKIEKGERKALITIKYEEKD